MIILENISKSFGAQDILKGISAQIAQGQFVSIVGQTGCGKTTLLNILSGNEEPSSGAVTLPAAGNLSYVLQDNVMLPWRTLRENIHLPIEVQRPVSAENKDVITGYIQRFGLSGYEEYYPQTASGGMKQRTALIRALVMQPDLLLLDEPFSSLDFEMKLKIQREMLDYQRLVKATIIMVTHDIEDAIAMSDQVIILAGKPAQVSNKLSIELGLAQKDPVLARKSAHFPAFFSKIWDGLKYQ